MNTIMKKHKPFLLLCAAFCMILFLTGCDSMEDRQNISKWQAQEISEALEEEIANCIGEKPAYFQLMQLQCPLYGSLNDACDNMFHVYYDGTNLYEVLSEDDIECAIFFDNGRDVSQDSLDQIAEHMDFCNHGFLYSGRK